MIEEPGAIMHLPPVYQPPAGPPNWLAILADVLGGALLIAGLPLGLLFLLVLCFGANP